MAKEAQNEEIPKILKNESNFEMCYLNNNQII